VGGGHGQKKLGKFWSGKVVGADWRVESVDGCAIQKEGNGIQG